MKLSDLLRLIVVTLVTGSSSSAESPAVDGFGSYTFRGIPYERNGERIGARVYAIKKGSIWETLGLKNGDIVVQVGESASDYNSTRSKLLALESSKGDRTSFVIERGGERLLLNESGATVMATKVPVETRRLESLVVPGRSAEFIELIKGDGRLTQYFLRDARFVPYYQGGRVTGLRVSAIRKDSPWDQAGMKDGDVIHTCNGTTILDPATLVTATRDSLLRSPEGLRC